MAQTFINNDPNFSNVTELKTEINKLKKEIIELELQVSRIQQRCRHVFIEEVGFRKCIKCNTVEVNYY